MGLEYWKVRWKKKKTTPEERTREREGESEIWARPGEQNLPSSLPPLPTYLPTYLPYSYTNYLLLLLLFFQSSGWWWSRSHRMNTNTLLYCYCILLYCPIARFLFYHHEDRGSSPCILPVLIDWSLDRLIAWHPPDPPLITKWGETSRNTPSSFTTIPTTVTLLPVWIQHSTRTHAHFDRQSSTHLLLACSSIFNLQPSTLNFNLNFNLQSLPLLPYCNPILAYYERPTNLGKTSFATPARRARVSYMVQQQPAGRSHPSPHTHDIPTTEGIVSCNILENVYSATEKRIKLSFTGSGRQ